MVFFFLFFFFFVSPRLAISQSNSVANNPVGGGKAPSCQGLHFLSETRGLAPLPSSVAFPLRHPEIGADRASRSLCVLCPAGPTRGRIWAICDACRARHSPATRSAPAFSAGPQLRLCPTDQQL